MAISASKARSITIAAASGVRPAQGLLYLALAGIAFAVAFQDGIAALVRAWGQVEYSHGPLIPLISGYLFLRQLRDVPRNREPVPDRWPGGLLILLSALMALAGTLSGIHEVVAYAIIVWAGGMVLASFGWRRGLQFWPPVLHLAFMLPLPGLLYYKTSAALQFLSSEIGVGIIAAAGVPVLLDGNIITLNDFRLHVAEACSGLRYLFPVMSFTYIFAVLYRGSMWHKAALLLAAVPIAVMMNAVRVGVIGIMVDRYGIAHAEGFMHLFEGWVVFGITIALMVALSWGMRRFSGGRGGVLASLDLDSTGVLAQLGRVADIRPSGALLGTSLATGLLLGAAQAAPALGVGGTPLPQREPFLLFTRTLESPDGTAWRTASEEILKPRVARVLGADDYLSRTLVASDGAEGAGVGLFVAWYRNQGRGGVHSPEICLPGNGWEIASINPVEREILLPGGGTRAITLNRAIIQKGVARQLVYYWFDQRGRRIASDYAAKAYLLLDGVRDGRTDGALVRLITPILPGEAEADAEARLGSALAAAMPELPRFIATDWPVHGSEIGGADE